MPLTRDFRETVRERAHDEPEFRQALLREAVSCMLNGEVDIGRETLYDCIEPGIGFDELSQKTGKSRESLEHVLSDGGNPRADDLLGIVAALAEYENMELEVQVAQRSRAEQLVAA